MAAGALLAAVVCFLPVFALRAPYGYAPVLVEEPADTVVIPVGLVRSANLSCRAISYGVKSVIEWYKDDVALETTSGLGLPGYNVTNSSLVVATTDPRDDGAILEGTYYCLVSNAFGAVRSKSALVKTQGLVSYIRDTGSIFGSTETVVFAQLIYTQKPLIRWSIDCDRSTVTCPGVSCPLWHHVSVAGRLLLFSLLRLTYNGIKTLIPECNQTDDTISVIASPSAETDTVKFSGTSFIPRNQLNEIRNFFVQVGASATLYCISNHPNSTYTWKRDGSPIQVANHSRYSLIIDGVLQIRKVQKTDGGLYICTATAVYPADGQQTRSRNTKINLTVYSLPNVNLTLVQDENLSTNCDAISTTTACKVNPIVSSVSIVCYFDGSVPLLVQILHNAVIIFQQTVADNQRSVQHNYNATNRRWSGVYQCVANNSYGSTQISLYVAVQGSAIANVSTVASSTPTAQQTIHSSALITKRSTQAALSTSNTLSYLTTQQSSGHSATSETTPADFSTSKSSVSNVSTAASFTPTVQQTLRPSILTTRKATQAAATLSTSNVLSHPTTQQSSGHSTTSETTPADISTSKKYGFSGTPIPPALKTSAVPDVNSSTPTAQQTTSITRKATQTGTTLSTSSTLFHPNSTQQPSGHSTTPETAPANASLFKNYTDTPSPSVLTSSAGPAANSYSTATVSPKPTSSATTTQSSTVPYNFSMPLSFSDKTTLNPTAANDVTKHQFLYVNRSSYTTILNTETTSASDGKTEESSGGGLPLAAVAGGAAGGCVLLLAIILIVFLCKRRKQSFSPDEHKAKGNVQSSIVLNNPVYGGEVTDRDDSRLSSSQMSQKTQSAYDTLNKPTAFVQPVTRQTGPKDNETDQVSQYDVLNRNTDELPVTITNNPADGAYSVLHDGTRPSKEPVRRSPSDDEYSQVTTDGQPIQLGSYELLGAAIKPNTPPDFENPYELPESEKPKISTSAQRSVVPSDGEYSYATTDVKQPVSTSSDHVTAGGVEYSVSHKERLSTTSTRAYEDIEFDAQQPKRFVNSEKDNTYAVPDERKTKSTGQTAVPSMTEYSYARPDSTRPMEILSDCLVVGTAVTARREEDEKQPGDGENPYSLPDETKPKKVRDGPLSFPPTNAEYSYANPDMKRPVLVAPDRLAVGKDLYALPNKQATHSQSDAADKSNTTRQPSNPPKRYTAGEDQYAVPDKRLQKKPPPSSQTKPDARLSATATVPDHFSAGDDQYALPTKRSASQKEKDSRDRVSNLQIEHYHAGEDQYAVSAKSIFPPQYSVVAEYSVDQPANRKESSDVQYADLDEFETKSTRKERTPPNQETVAYAAIDRVD